jgi:hypothetical protein
VLRNAQSAGWGDAAPRVRKFMLRWFLRTKIQPPIMAWLPQPDWQLKGHAYIHIQAVAGMQSVKTLSLIYGLYLIFVVLQSSIPTLCFIERPLKSLKYHLSLQLKRVSILGVFDPDKIFSVL